MIVTVTPNPSLDRTVHLPTTLIPHHLNRAITSDLEPSGKGVNVSLALHAANYPTIAVLPVGGTYGDQILRHLAEIGLPTSTVRVAGLTRSNITLIEGDGSTTKINEPGPLLLRAEVDRLLDFAFTASHPGDWVTFCGSLADGFELDLLVKTIAELQAHGRRVAVDSSDAALEAVVAAPPGSVPSLVKPNVHELAALSRQPIRTLGDVVIAARAVQVRGIETVLVSLGADGAVLCKEGASWFGQLAVRKIVNTAGAGDAFLAGYLAARHNELPDEQCLRTALSWGAAAVQTDRTALIHPAENVAAAAQITATDHSDQTPLSDPALNHHIGS